MFDGTIENLGFGGQGILRHQGLVIFVPFTAPGDKIRCQITETKKNFAKGKVVEILQESPYRTKPRCPYFETCGGCQLQHLTYEMQLDHKKQCVADAIKRIGHLDYNNILPTIPAQQWGYRRHVTLNLKPCDFHFEAGYFTLDNKTLVNIETCPIFIDSPTEIFQQIHKISAQLHCAKNNKGRVTIFKLPEEKFLLHFYFDSLPKNCTEIFKNYPTSTCKGILVSAPNKSLSWGIIESVLEIEGMKFLFSPKVFIQNHPEQSLNIYRQILKTASSLNIEKALDLYCGIGISSHLLAKQLTHVIGVESNQAAIDLAVKNSQLNNIDNVRFILADVKEVLVNLLAEFNPQLVIVNPPRTGLDPNVVQALIDNPLPAIIYISCMPSTLARDLQILCNEHFRIEYIQPYDMFPQTAHVETLTLLTRR